jgi:tetratricopeptide (TPR) repeat protein
LKSDVTWLIVATIIAYATAIPGGFIWLDHAEIEHANYRVVDAGDWSRVWRETIEQYQGKRSGVVMEHGGYWRPIYALSVSLDWMLWNGRPWLNHLENILWHLAVVLGLYYLGNQVFGATPQGRRAVFWATLLFAVHPFGVHSVTWISGRKDTMCAAFGVAALLAFGRVASESTSTDFGWGRVSRWFALAGVCLALSIGCKELGFVVPLVATVFYWPPLDVGADRRLQHQRNARLIGLAVLWACAGALLAYRFAVVHASGLDAPYPTESLPRNIAMSANVLWHYVARILLPFQVQLSDAWPVVQQFGAVDALAILSIIIAVIATAYGLVRRRPVALAAAWFMIWIMPATGIVPLRHFRAERYLYPASWGVLVAAMLLLLPALSNLFASHAKRATAIICTLVVVWFGLVTAKENTFWWDDATLFSHSVAIAPHHVEGQIELSRLALEEDNFPEAVQRARQALEQLSNPSYVAYGVPYYAHTWLGTGLVRLRQPAAAMKEFQAALRQMPNSPAGYSNLAMAEVALGDLPAARRHFERSLELDPSDNSVRFNLSLALLQMGEYAAAEQQIERLAREQPDDATHRARLAWCQWKLGKQADAKRNLAEAQKQSPDDPIVRSVVQMILREQPNDESNAE